MTFGLSQSEMPDQGGDVIRHQLEAQRAADICGASMCLQIDGDDPAVRSQRRKDRAEHFNGADAAVQQNKANVEAG